MLKEVHNAVKTKLLQNDVGGGGIHRYIDLPIDVVSFGIVASKCKQDTKAKSDGEKYLHGSINPHLN